MIRTPPLESTVSSFGIDSVPELAFTLLWIGTFALGLTIAAIAYRGYRRNRSRPMLFIAIGFGLIFVVHGLAAAISLVVEMSLTTERAIAMGTQFVGLACILYGLRTE